MDHWLGEPSHAYHPLPVFGRWASTLEHIGLNPADSPLKQKIAGCMMLCCALLPSLIGLIALVLTPELQNLFGIVILYFCLGARSLQQHAQAVYQALRQQDLPLARQQVGQIVSRQTGHMTYHDVRRAAIESVLENGADAVFAPLFWFVVLGPFGALLYRFSNTLDAMWGYKNHRYRHFGWAAARLDDLLNWVPARLTALGYALLGNTAPALKAWRQQAGLLESPNGGPVMTAGAGALALQLGGPARYHGQIKLKPWFGGNKLPENRDINLACGLIKRTLVLWLVVIALGDSLA